MAWLRCCALLLLGSLGACEEVSPDTRTGMWSPTGANARNIAAMAAHPRDLIRGHGEPGSDGLMTAAAVGRLQQGRPKPILSIGAGATPGGDAPAAALPPPAAPAGAAGTAE